jgi:hypothetical protein
MADNTPHGSQKVRRLFELHLLPKASKVRVSDIRSGDLRAVIRALIDGGKVTRGIAIHMYTNAMFIWAGRRKPWKLLFDLNPLEDVDIDRMLPPDYQDWCERVLEDDEIIELRNRFDGNAQHLEVPSRSAPRNCQADPARARAGRLDHAANTRSYQ